MAYRDDQDDDVDSDGPRDSEYPDKSDTDGDEGDEFAETVPCPRCGKQVYEGAEVCPRCGQYISEETTVRRQPMWIVVGVVLALAVVLLVWVM